MSMISLSEAAARFGLPVETVQEWTKRGLLPVYAVGQTNAQPPAGVGLLLNEQSVDEEELASVVESLGWLQLSVEAWDSSEGE